MVKEEFSIRSSDDIGSMLHCVEWHSDGTVSPAGVIQLVHGMIEYIERYEEFAQYMTDHGFVVIGHDHIGHGHSVPENRPQELGIMHTRAPEKVMCRDMLSVYEYGREKYPDVPYFILGHSMGSFMLRRFLSVYADETEDLSGAIIVGTGSTPTPAVIFAKIVLCITALFHGWDYKSQTVTNIMFAGDYRRFSMDGTEPENSWLSKNVDSVKKYYSDPFDTYLFSLNGYRGMTSAMIYDNSVRKIRRIRKDLPVLFASGTDDPVGAMSRGVKAAFKKFKKAGIRDLTLKLFEGDRHEILNETDRDRVYDYIYSWIKKHV